MSATIQQHSQGFGQASGATIPPEIAALLGAEQKSWREIGEPAGIVRFGETMEDFTPPDAAGARVSLGDMLADARSDYTARTKMSAVVAARDALAGDPS